MPRPRKCRRVCSMPDNTEFAPVGADFIPADAVVMTVDEYESIRLIDHQGFTHEECAGYMKIARTTVQQIYNDARKKLSVVREALMVNEPDALVFVQIGRAHV